MAIFSSLDGGGAFLMAKTFRRQGLFANISCRAIAMRYRGRGLIPCWSPIFCFDFVAYKLHGKPRSTVRAAEHRSTFRR